MDNSTNEQTTQSITPIELLHLVKKRLSEVYGQRLKGVVLYGSRARGDAQEDSDYDFLVLLEGPVKYGTELRVVTHALFKLELSYSVQISPKPADISEYEKGQYSVFNKAKLEGIAA